VPKDFYKKALNQSLEIAPLFWHDECQMEFPEGLRTIPAEIRCCGSIQDANQYPELAQFMSGKPCPETDTYTVAEAFADAGFPVPEGKELCIYLLDGEESIGFEDKCVYDDDAWTVRDIDGEFLWYPTAVHDDLAHTKVEGIYITRLPAKDAWEQLPSVVRDHPVVREKVGVAEP